VKPLVSVCIPAFNAAHLLAGSVGSATRQTYANPDILVLDNASTDDTTSVVNALSTRNSRVRYLVRRADVGGSAITAVFRKPREKSGTRFPSL